MMSLGYHVRMFCLRTVFIALALSSVAAAMASAQDWQRGIEYAQRGDSAYAQIKNTKRI